MYLAHQTPSSSTWSDAQEKFKGLYSFCQDTAIPSGSVEAGAMRRNVWGVKTIHTDIYFRVARSLGYNGVLVSYGPGNKLAQI